MKQLFAPAILFILFCSCTPSWQKLHHRSILIDTHNDVLSSVTMRGMNIDHDLTGKTHTDISRLEKGGMDIQVFSIFCDERFGKDTAYKYANIEIDSLYAIVARNKSRMMMVTSPEELEQAVQSGKIGSMIGVEGGHMIENNLDHLEALYKRGARYLTLTWNNSTEWASSAADEARTNAPEGIHYPDTVNWKGLSLFGRQVVRKMNELGMMVDVSHVGEQTFRDVIEVTNKPVIASHSCAHALCPVPRNLKDDQILAIGKNGGVIHLNFYSGFVDSTYNERRRVFIDNHRKERDSLRRSKMPRYEIDEWISEKYPEEASTLRPPLSLLLDHLDHIVKLIGIDHVGLGSDFDGIESAPVPLDDVTSFPLLTKALMERGYTKKDVKKILGENFIRVFKANQQQ